MTTTKLRTVPDWLDLNAIVASDLRERMRVVAERVRDLEPVLAELESESVELRDAYTAALRGADADADLSDLVGLLSGFDALYEAWMTVAGRACNVTDCVPI
jgi:hypothetical protein